MYLYFPFSVYSTLVWVHMMCGDVHQKFKDFVEASNQFSIAIQSSADSQNHKTQKTRGLLYFKRASVYFKLEKYKEAFQDGNEMLRIVPKYIMGRIVMANCAIKLGCIDLATQNLVEASNHASELASIANSLKNALINHEVSKVRYLTAVDRTCKNNTVNKSSPGFRFRWCIAATRFWNIPHTIVQF